MRFFFYIQDRNNVVTRIQDPIGWDALALVLKRDLGKHGIIFDYQDNEFEYQGKAAQLLRAEYNTYGAEGKMNLIINYKCPTGEKLLYAGRFSFDMWEDNYGEECNVVIPVQTTSDLMTFRNRIDQKVQLQSVAAFDGSPLPAYAALPFSQTLPGKSIFVQDYSVNSGDLTGAWIGEWESDGLSSFGFPQVAFFTPCFNKRVVGEIGVYNHNTDVDELVDITIDSGWSLPAAWIPLPYYQGIAGSQLKNFPVDLISPIVNYDSELGRVFGDAPLAVTLEGKFDADIITHQVSGNYTGQGIFCWNLYLGILKGNKDPEDPLSWNWISNFGNISTWSIMPVTGSWTQAGGSTTSPITFTESIVLERGDRIYYFFNLEYDKKNAYSSDPAFDIKFKDTTYFKLSGLSVIPDTTSKLFMVNEAWSRIAEAITDGSIKAYSEFYGRTDSEPYAVAQDGCGSLTALTSGLHIRRMDDKLADTPPIYALSFNELFAGLNPIHNIGVGMENDPARPGYHRVRIESWEYFYPTTVAHSCIGVQQIKRKIIADRHTSVFKFGYDTWEAEQFNGIDEFLTNREYRTELTQINQTLSQLSTFIASGFALEVTRRLGNETSEDWRYDKNTFVIAMKRDGSDIVVQLGSINNPSNIVDPATIYNFALRPSVMALRWLPKVLASYRVANTTTQIIFMDGEGNVYAEGTLADGCRVEGSSIMSEKQNLLPDLMDSPAEGLPIWQPENVEFDFPLSVADFQKIKANPHGLIHYENGQVSGDGWIEFLNYKPEAGIGEFTLIPRR